MANVIKLKKGLDINLRGKPSSEITNAAESELFAIVPDDYHGIIPKIIVKPGDHVLAGTPVMYDKNQPDVKFVSPVSGEIIDVERGERRKVLKITIKPDKKQQYIDFGIKDPDHLTADEIKKILSEAGMFAYIKQRPYDIIANPAVQPRDIFMTAFDSAPLAPDFSFILKGEEKNLETGLRALSKLTTGKIYAGVSARQPVSITNAETVIFDGPHPAGNAGVQIQHIAPVNKGETVWTVNALDVLFIGRLFNEGKTDFSRIVAVTGSEVENPHYVRSKVGASIDSIINGNIKDNGYHLRYISGNVLTGTHVNRNDYLCAPHSHITVIPEGDERNEFFGWATPGLGKFSVSHSYFSWLMGSKKEFTIDARIRGGERAIIMSDEYDRVFPMNILPEFLIKAIIAFDIDKMENLGIYEVAPEDFALCEFVDTSKLELQKIVRNGLDLLKKEMN